MIDVECPPEPTAPVEFESGSFRDRASRVFHQRGRVYRALSESGLADWDALSAAPFFQRAMRDGKIVHSFRVAGDAESAVADAAETQHQWAAVLQHDRIPFISYPYEWCFSMLRDAALLHLELMTAALEEDFILKDASAFNVQWDGASPVFIDVGSFTRHPAGQPWLQGTWSEQRSPQGAPVKPHPTSVGRVAQRASSHTLSPGPWPCCGPLPSTQAAGSSQSLSVSQVPSPLSHGHCGPHSPSSHGSRSLRDGSGSVGTHEANAGS